MFSLLTTLLSAVPVNSGKPGPAAPPQHKVSLKKSVSMREAMAGESMPDVAAARDLWSVRSLFNM